MTFAMKIQFTKSGRWRCRSACHGFSAAALLGCTGAVVGTILAASAACGTGAPGAPPAEKHPADGAASDSSSDAGADTQAADSSVMGTVVDAVTSRPLAGRVVYVSGRMTTTGVDGRFSVDVAGTAYDATVVDPDGSTISMYRGLHRRDPRLAHRRSSVPDVTANSATVAGSLSGGTSYPLGLTDTISVYLFANEADTSESLGSGLPSLFDGPSYGPLRLAWNGTAQIAAHLIALGAFRGNTADAGDAGPSWWLSQQAISVANGESQTINLALKPASTGNVSGQVQLPAGAFVTEKQASFALPTVHATIPLNADQTPATSFAYAIPEPPSPDWSLCVEGVASPGVLITRLCGVAAGATDLHILLRPSPTLLSPPDGAAVARDTEFSWTPFNGGVHLLELESNPSTRSAPSIYVFTSATNATWPDLQPFGVAFPSNTTYRCAVGGIGPLSTMDDAFGPGGLGTPIGGESSESYAPPIRVTTGP